MVSEVEGKWIKNHFEFKRNQKSQTISTVTLNLRKNLELKNNCIYMKYLSHEQQF